MKLRSYLKQYGIKGMEFAATIKCSSPALSLYMSGLRTPRPEIARRIVAATGGLVSYEDLYGEPTHGTKPTERQDAA